MSVSPRSVDRDTARRKPTLFNQSVLTPSSSFSLQVAVRVTSYGLLRCHHAVSPSATLAIAPPKRVISMVLLCACSGALTMDSASWERRVGVSSSMYSERTAQRYPAGGTYCEVWNPTKCACQSSFDGGPLRGYPHSAAAVYNPASSTNSSKG